MIIIRMRQGTGKKDIQNVINSIAIQVGRSNCEFFVNDRKIEPRVIIFSRNGVEKIIKADFAAELAGIIGFSRFADDSNLKKQKRLKRFYPNYGF